MAQFSTRPLTDKGRPIGTALLADMGAEIFIIEKVGGRVSCSRLTKRPHDERVIAWGKVPLAVRRHARTTLDIPDRKDD